LSARRRIIEDVLQYIRQNWDFMTQDQCVPIEVALKLMDSSSLGLASQYGQFRTTHQELQQALKAIVNGKSCRAATISP
jgi:exocyst complex component 4